MADLDLAPIVDHPAVLAVDTEREIFAYAENGTEVKQQASPFVDIVIFTFSPSYPEDNDAWTALTQDILFGDSLKEDNFILISPVNTRGLGSRTALKETGPISARSHQLRPGQAHATLVNPAMLNPPMKRNCKPFRRSQTSRSPDYFETSEGQLWKKLFDSLTIVDQSFSVTASSYLPAVSPFTSPNPPDGR